MAAKKKAAAAASTKTLATPAPPSTSPASLAEVEVELSVELGRHTLTLDQALSLGDQSLFELDKMVGEPVEVKLNGKPFARGEVVTVAENFGVRITEILAGG
ncbi:MAG: FliM/FliN family flagellar motor switch protein [Candidatus Latescibacteria bacterium]|nr:FliM/FliN family flagellar motor switch protein [Candidatus Latescibacterota bacterium]